MRSQVASSVCEGLARAVTSPTRGRPSRLMLRELQKVQWRDIMANDPVFRDLESADDPDGALSNKGQPSHLDRLDAETFGATEHYYRRLDLLAPILPYVLDRRIGLAIAAGKSMRKIKETFNVGQSRIDRVHRAMRAWIPERFWREWEELRSE